MSQKRKSHKLQSSAEVLQSLLKNGKEPLAQQFEQLRIIRQWEEIVGTEIAQHGKPVGVFKGILYIWVNSAPRMQEMSFLAKHIKDKVNLFAKKSLVRRIHFTMDAKSLPSEIGVRGLNSDREV